MRHPDGQDAPSQGKILDAFFSRADPARDSYTFACVHSLEAMPVLCLSCLCAKDFWCCVWSVCSPLLSRGECCVE